VYSESSRPRGVILPAAAEFFDESLKKLGLPGELAFLLVDAFGERGDLGREILLVDWASRFERRTLESIDRLGFCWLRFGCRFDDGLCLLSRLGCVGRSRLVG